MFFSNFPSLEPAHSELSAIWLSKIGLDHKDKTEVYQFIYNIYTFKVLNLLVFQENTV